MGLDTASFEAVFDAHYERCVRAARRITRDQQVAEELASEAFARAWSRWSRLGREPQRAVGWIWRVTMNLAIDHARRRLPALPRPEPIESDDAVAVHVALVEALRLLSGRQRDVIVLRYLADMSEAEVAHALGVSTGSVKTHVHRGLTRLRSAFGRDEQNEEVLLGLDP